MSGANNAIFEHNLAILAGCCSISSLHALRDSPGNGRAIFKNGSDDKPALFLKLGDNELPLHSRRDPRAEAVRQLDEAFPQAPGDCVAIGLAGLHHLLELAARMPPRSRLIVIDPFPDIARTVLEHLDLAPLLKLHAACSFIFNDDLETLRRDFRSLIRKHDRPELQCFMHPGLSRHFPGLFQKLMNDLKGEIQLEMSDRLTRATLAGDWIANAVPNLPLLLGNPSLEVLRDAFPRSATAIIAAAGPTLDHALPMIAGCRPHCLVFAVGTAMRPLCHAGITPDFVVALDSDQPTVRQLPETIPQESFLIGAPSIPGQFFEAFHNRSFPYSFSAINGFNQWLAGQDFPLPVLNVGGTVSLTAIDAALFLGCRNIVLAGLDLAMREDGMTHASESMYANERMAGGDMVRVKGNYSESVPTSIQFATYIRQMNSYLMDVSSGGKVRFYNATTGGAFIDNTHVVHPDAFRVPPGGVDREEISARIAARRRAAAPSHDPHSVRRTLETLATQLPDLRRTAEEAAGLIAGNHTPENHPGLAAILASIDEHPALCLVNAAIQKTRFAIRSGLAHPLCVPQAIAGSCGQLANLLELGMKNFDKHSDECKLQISGKPAV